MRSAPKLRGGGTAKGKEEEALDVNDSSPPPQENSDPPRDKGPQRTQSTQSISADEQEERIAEVSRRMARWVYVRADDEAPSVTC